MLHPTHSDQLQIKTFECKGIKVAIPEEKFPFSFKENNQQVCRCERTYICSSELTVPGQLVNNDVRQSLEPFKHY